MKGYKGFDKDLKCRDFQYELGKTFKMEDKEWVLKNVEEICANTRDVDEVCIALEHSTIFATEIIQNLTKTILDLQQENQQYKNAWEELKNKLEKIITTTESMQVHDYVNYVYADMQELEQKHNLDKEQLYMNKEQLVRKGDK